MYWISKWIFKAIQDQSIKTCLDYIISSVQGYNYLCIIWILFSNFFNCFRSENLVNINKTCIMFKENVATDSIYLYFNWWKTFVVYFFLSISRVFQLNWKVHSNIFNLWVNVSKVIKKKSCRIVQKVIRGSQSHII